MKRLDKATWLVLENVENLDIRFDNHILLEHAAFEEKILLAVIANAQLKYGELVICAFNTDLADFFEMTDRAFAGLLENAERKRFIDLIPVFVNGKHWDGYYYVQLGIGVREKW